MAQLARTRRQLEKEAIIKVFNENLQRYETVIVPSGITIGVGAAGFDKGIKLHGPMEFKTATAPADTSLRLYVVGSTLYFDGSEVGSGGGGAPTDAQYVTLATDSTLTDERVLTAGSNITITDDPAGSTVTIAASAGAGGWTDDGTDVRLTTATDSVGIGTTSPSYKLHVSTDAATEAEVGVTQYNNSTATDGPNLRLLRARGTEGSPSVVQDGDHLGSVFWYGHDGTNFEAAAAILCDVDGSPAGDSTDMPGRLTFCTTPDGSDTVIERMRILSSGEVGIGTDAPSTVLHVEGDAVTIGNGSTGPGEIRLLEDTDLGSYYGGFKAGNLTENTMYVLPTSLPASNKVLQSDSSGMLVWVTDATHDDVGWVGYANDEIITTGSVGIGASASPAERLEVLDADGTATTAQVNNTGGGDPQFSLAVAGTKKCTWGIDNDDSDKFKLGTTACSTGTVLTIDFDSGYAGFGTETPAEALEVETGAAGQTTTTIQVSNTATTGDPQVAFALSGVKKFTMGVDDSDSDKFKIGTTACSTDTMLTIDADGNVGIGATSPQAYLDIKNTVDDGQTNRTMLRLHNYRPDDADVNDFAPTSIDFVVENVTGGAKSATSRISAVSAPIGTDHTSTAGEKSGALIFSTMNNTVLAEAVRINNLGRVGIGTAAPSGSLDVKGDGSTSQIFLLSGSGAEASPDESAYTDTNFFVSGSIGSKDSSIKGTSVFGGDVVASGSVYAGSVIPIADNIYDLGAPYRRYANIYTGDLHLQNERGHWQIIEERDYLCVVNRLTGKRYKMALEPIDDDE